MSPRLHSPVLCGVFFLSGAAALVFETLWFRRAGLVFGNSVWAGALVLSSFMAGLALGNGLAARHGKRILRPERWYALIELLVALTGIALVIGFPALNAVLAPVFRPLLPETATLNVLRLSISFVLLMIPATAMGMTLPLLVKALLSESALFGRALGRLYGWNTLGAVAGSLLGEVVLIERFGIIGTSFWAGAFNVVAALGALAVARGGSVRLDPASTPRKPLGARAKRLLAASFLSGGILLAFEVVWFRFLQLFFQGTTLTFALMLSVVLAGIGLGGLLASFLFRLSPQSQRGTVVLALLAGIVSVLTYTFFDLGLGSRTETETTGYGLEDPYLFFTLMFPTSLLSGILFSLIGHAAHQELDDETRSAGLVTMANTIGATLGPMIAGFFLIPRIGMEKSFLVLSGGYLLVAVLAFDGAGKRVIELAAAAGLVVSLALFPHGRMARYLDIASEAYQDDGSEVVAVKEGLTETIQYLRNDFLGEPHDYRLVTNSFSMSGTHWGAVRYMKYYVYWPVAMRPDPKNALLISFGCGSTTKALTDTESLESIAVVDISQEILDLADLVYTPEENPLNDPRVDVYIEDGRFFLQTTGERYDIITGDPPPPKQAGVVNLCTQEYFELMRDRLADGGVATYWLPTMQFEEHEVKSMLAGFLNAFGDEATVWGAIGLTWVMIGTKNAQPVDYEDFTAQWRDPEIAADLRALGFEQPGLLGATFLMDADDLREYTAGVEPLTDDWPKRMSARLGTGATPENIERYRRVMDVAAAQQRFRESEYIRRLWPQRLIDECLEGFRVQDLLNDITTPSPTQRALQFGEVHHFLTETDLEVPILWAFDSSPRMQAILDVADPAEKKRRRKIVAHHLGVRAMSQRDYDEAERLFAESQERRPDRRGMFTRAYLLCLAGRHDDAKAFIQAEPDWFADGTGQAFVAWLRDFVGYTL